MSIQHTCFIAGHAKFPQRMAAQSVFDSLTITAEVDRKYGVILGASCTLVTNHGRQYIHDLLKGMSLKTDLVEMEELIAHQYKGKATNAIIAAVQDLYRQYEMLVME